MTGKPNALVTGGAGFIGSHLVDRLVDDGWSVLVVDDLSHGHLERLAQARRAGEVQVHQLDIRSPDLRAVAARFGPDVIFHLAAQSGVRPSVEDPRFDAEVNVVGTVNVLAAAAEVGAQRVVFASSGGAIYGEVVGPPADEQAPRLPDAPYGISKKIVEDYFRYFRQAGGVDYVLLALANVYGPRQDAAGEAGVVAIFSSLMLAGGHPIINGDGNQTRDFVYVGDVVDAFVRAAEIGGPGLFNIGSGREVSVIELFTLLSAMCGYRGDPVFGPAKAGDLRRSVIDPSAAERQLGWSAWTSLETGLRKTVDWFRRRN